MSTLPSSPDVYDDVHRRIVAVIEGARHSAARQVNATMTAAYWQVGQRIVAAEQGGASRAAYGQALIAELSGDLTRRFGRGFSPANLASMRAFHLAWPLEEIFQTLSGKSADGGTLDAQVLRERFPLPWSAYVRLLSVKRPEARDFYEREALREGWSVRQLDRQIGSQLYERLVLSKNKAALLDQAATAEASETMTPEEALRDPFVLEFLNLKDQYSESDLEEGLIQHLADFLLELGDDFAYVGRQRRLRIDDAWFRVDLLFFHRRLKCLIIIDLKVGRFSYADAGQMHMYLNYAREHWMKPGENPPVGLILCAEKGSAEARYALENLPNKVLAAEYQMVLPDTTLIAEELQRTQIELSRANRLRQVKHERSD